MLRPSRTTLYVLIAAFVVLAIIALLAGGFLSVLLWVVLAALVVYFAVVAVRELGRAREA
jgi:amino acid transporter